MQVMGAEPIGDLEPGQFLLVSVDPKSDGSDDSDDSGDLSTLNVAKVLEDCPVRLCVRFFVCCVRTTSILNARHVSEAFVGGGCQ